MTHLSHGEATPPAKPLSEFPSKDWTGYAQVIEWPLDKETLDVLGVTDYPIADTGSRAWSQI